MRAIRKPRDLKRIRKIFDVLKDWVLSDEDHYNEIMLEMYNDDFKEYLKQNKIKEPTDLNGILESFETIFATLTKETVKEFSNVFNDWLDHMLWDDFFGTEGQLDPRGDRRE